MGYWLLWWIWTEVSQLIDYLMPLRCIFTWFFFIYTESTYQSTANVHKILFFQIKVIWTLSSSIKWGCWDILFLSWLGLIQDPTRHLENDKATSAVTKCGKRGLGWRQKMWVEASLVLSKWSWYIDTTLCALMTLSIK